MTLLNRHLFEPISALTHLLGAIGSLIGLVILLKLTWPDTPKTISMLIYGLSMALLFSSSALLHGLKTTAANHLWLNRLDHSAIFLVIAGTYTPVAYNVFPDPWRWSVLIVVWAVFFLGAIYKMRSAEIHGFLNTSVYVLFGWGSAAPLLFAANLFSLLPLRALLLLLFGGLIYTVGFIVYYFKRPDPWPQIFGHHEIWHLFVLSGSVCHFLFMLRYIVPLEKVAIN